MKKEATISVKGRQQLDDPEADISTLVTEGFLHKRLAQYYITYDETALTGMDGTKTTVHCDPCSSSVSVIRAGKYPSHLIFEKGKRHNTLYDTDFGQLTVAVSTIDISTDMGDNGGNITVRYDVEIDHMHCGTNELTIDVTVR